MWSDDYDVPEDKVRKGLKRVGLFLLGVLATWAGVISLPWLERVVVAIARWFHLTLASSGEFWGICILSIFAGFLMVVYGGD